MKLQFKHQKFQADAAKAVVDVFAGQPYLTPTYMMDRGNRVYRKRKINQCIEKAPDLCYPFFHKSEALILFMLCIFPGVLLPKAGIDPRFRHL